ncbi:GntR family transcriptional regulator [Chromobacterium sp. IIBBL 290-4]|uniref:GntR family transcriptional regulator n=1 Tax=Chromobacterium sp. IIBBL 290-4 TaxID=2953890 RepID=UPI0020B87A40|nr:GntR family transcriptional regulator [Chromobacterium sp. IIBBL 290-4]UTH74995.1 GntR family transcriptional regulator [Chromobacterium sp. IIBBL 290-4]
MTVNALKRQPLYAQVKQVLRQRMAEGEWRAHDALPSEWDLAGELGASQGTVRKALTELVADGLLYREQGRGTFVAPVPSDWGESSLLTPGLFQEQPDELAREFLGLSRLNASEDIAAALKLRRLAPLWRVRLLWRWHAAPVALDDVLLPAETFDTLDARWLRSSEGVHATLQQRFGVRLKVVCEQFRAEMLPREEASLLGVTGMVADVPALCLLRLSAGMDGQPLEWRQRYCLTHQLAYTVKHD